MNKAEKTPALVELTSGQTKPDSFVSGLAGGAVTQEGTLRVFLGNFMVSGGVKIFFPLWIMICRKM